MGKTFRYDSETASMHRASAMALQKRHGRHSGQIHKDRRAPRAGNRNLFAEYMNDADEERELREEIRRSPIK